MADFPTSIFTPRDTENLPGIVFDAAKKQVLFSEDYQSLGAEIEAIETYLLTPKKFKALISQSGTNAPILTIVENTLGFTPTFTRLEAGVYVSGDAEWSDFLTKKVLVSFAVANYYPGNNSGSAFYDIEEADFYVVTFNPLGVYVDNALSDSDLFTQSTLMIEVYD